MWDSTLLAYADRGRVIPAAHRPYVTRRNGDVLPTLLERQHPDGGWGSRVSHGHDRLLTTLAVVLLLARTLLSQMDVPTRQTYVMALVEPEERTAAAATTNTARYVVRPIGPILAGAAASVGAGVPFVLAGGLKCVYDLVLWRWFRNVPLPDEAAR